MKKITKAVLFIYIIIFTVATNTTLNRVGMLLTVACGCGYYVSRKKFTLKKSAFLICMIFYGAVLFFSRLYTITPVSKADIVLTGYLSMLLIVFITMITVDDEADIRFYLNAFVIASLIQSIYMLSVYGMDIFEIIAESDEGIRVGDEVSNANTVGLSFAFGAVISLHFFLESNLPVYKKLFYGLVIIVGVVFALLSASKKALALIFVGVLFIMLSRSIDRKNAIKTLVSVGLSCVGLIMIYNMVANSELFTTTSDRITVFWEGIIGKGKLDFSSEERFRMIREGYNAFLDSPVLGQGVYSSYIYFRTYSHNNFIEILMNTGLIGFVIFYYPYFSLGRDFFRIEKSEKLYGLMLFLVLWIFVSGYGMVTYYAKYEMMLMALVSSWIIIKKGEKNEI